MYIMILTENGKFHKSDQFEKNIKVQMLILK
jgi:hypothetical protein